MNGSLKLLNAETDSTVDDALRPEDWAARAAAWKKMKEEQAAGSYSPTHPSGMYPEIGASLVH